MAEVRKPRPTEQIHPDLSRPLTETQRRALVTKTLALPPGKVLLLEREVPRELLSPSINGEGPIALTHEIIMRDGELPVFFQFSHEIGANAADCSTYITVDSPVEELKISSSDPREVVISDVARNIHQILDPTKQPPNRSTRRGHDLFMAAASLWQPGYTDKLRLGELPYENRYPVTQLDALALLDMLNTVQ